MAALHESIWLRDLPFVPLISYRDDPAVDEGIHRWMMACWENPGQHQVYDFKYDIPSHVMGADRRSKINTYLKMWHDAFINADLPAYLSLAGLWNRLMEFLPPSSPERKNGHRARSSKAWRRNESKKLGFGFSFNFLGAWPPRAIYEMRRLGYGFWQLYSLAMPVESEFNDQPFALNPREARAKGRDYMEFEVLPRVGEALSVQQRTAVFQNLPNKPSPSLFSEPLSAPLVSQPPPAPPVQPAPPVPQWVLLPMQLLPAHPPAP